MFKKRGFTLIEILIALAVITIISIVAISSISRMRPSQSLNESASNVVVMLREAREATLSGRGDSSWGVLVSTTSAKLFPVGYAPNNTPEDQYVYLDKVTANSTLFSDDEVFISFERLTGETTQSGEIIFSHKDLGVSSTRTVSIGSTGLVTYTHE